MLEDAAEHIREGNLRSAERLVRGVLKNQPRNPAALHLLGIIALQSGHARDAAGLFERAVAEDGENPGYRLSLGKALDTLGRGEAADEAFGRAVALGSRLPAAEVTRFARRLIADGRSREAAALFRQALAARPEDAAAHEGLAEALEDLGDRGGAIAAYKRAIALEPGFVEAHYNLATALSAAQRVQEAADAYERAVALKPDLAQGHHNLGICLRLLGRLEEAKRAYETALSINPRLVQSYSNLSVLLKEQGRFEEAIATCKRAIECNPGFAEGYSNLGNLYQLTRDFDRAASAYGRAIELAPDFAVVHGNLGEALRALGRLDQAAAAHQRALEIDPGLLRSYVDLGIALLQKGDPTAALEACEACLARSAGNTAALAFKATVLYELGRSAAARELIDFDRFVAVRPIEVPEDFGDLEAFNAALVCHARNHPSLVYAPTSHTTRGGQQSGELLSEPKGPVAHLETAIKRSVDRYIAELEPDGSHPFVARRPGRWGLSLWATILESEGRQVPHIHLTGWLSGVYYAQVPAALSDDREHAGWIRFGRSGLEYATTAAPEVRLVEPKAGLVVLFPSFFYHDTLAFNAADQRVSFAFDVIPEA